MCGFEGCDRPKVCKGLCGTHYHQMLRYGKLQPIRERYPAGATCYGPSCDRHPVSRGLCSGHLQQRERGLALWPLRRIRNGNEIIIEGDVARILFVDRRDKVVGHTLIDAADVPMVRAHRWRRTHGGRSTALYAVSHSVGLLHRLIMDCPADMEVDHISADTLDNRRANLRIVTHAENAQNVAHKGRAALRGVSAQRGGTFIAYACKMRRMHFRCGIKTREEAIAVAKALRAELMTHQNEERHQ